MGPGELANSAVNRMEVAGEESRRAVSVAEGDGWQFDDIVQWLRGHLEELYAASEDLASGDDASERTVVRLRNHLAMGLMCIRYLEDIAGRPRVLSSVVTSALGK